LAEGEKPHPTNYQGCSHAKEELQRKKSQKSPKTTMGSVFSSTLTAPGVSFVVALRGSRKQHQRPPAFQVPAAVEKPSAPASVRQQETGQSVPATNVNSLPLDNMLRVITVVQQITTEFNGAVSEEAKVVAITKTVLNLMKQNGH
jgi:hypothetical protein